ncbi:MAG: hypothetical protein WBB62_10935 [Rhodococcus sp. (in: high G+C Gram-positive bacteria)]
MARPIAAPAKPDTSDDELPAELHPENWRRWLPEVNDEPTTEWEREAAWPDGDTPNPFASVGEQRAFSLPTPVDGWRESVADRLREEAVAEWYERRGVNRWRRRGVSR